MKIARNLKKFSWLSILGAVGIACTESTVVGQETDTADPPDSADSETVDPSDTGSEVSTDTDELFSDAVPWPLENCWFLFRVTAEASGGDPEIFAPVSDVGPYDVMFQNALQGVVVSGPAPGGAATVITSAESLRTADSTEDVLRYTLEDFLLGGEFTTWRDSHDRAAASLDFFGSGVPVVFRYRGYLEAFDCGPPPFM